MSLPSWERRLPSIGEPAARVIDDSQAAGEWLRLWKMSLLNRASAATGILEALTASGMDEGIGEDHPVHAAKCSHHLSPES